jgi:isopentenyl diphosphate isomerase/L-lactate dehydrogenase-like FMN-dependent dehydrogenase
MELLNIDDYARAAADRLPTMVYDYYAGGAEDEVTVRENRLAWQRLALRPRCLVDVSERDLSTTVLGTKISMPILTAPCGFNALAHPDGELAVARAVTAAGTIQCVSTAATTSLEEVAAAAPDGVRWFQLYCYKDRGITQALVERATAAGYRAIVLTVDAPFVGRRERDIRNRFGLPPGLRWKNLEPYGFDRMDAGGDGSALVKYIETIWDAGLTWDAVDWLRSVSPLPIVLKGVLNAADARIAAGHGVDGIIVSNHGGRQLDGAISTAVALREIADTVGDGLELYVDSGIRRGSDVLKALALGARAALIGRPYLWGLALDGEAGVAHVLSLLRAELDLCLALSGQTAVRKVTRALLE